MAKTPTREDLRKQLEDLAKEDVKRLSDEHAQHEAAFADLYAERDKLNEKINELTTRRNEIAERLAREHVEPLNAIRNELSQAARDSGGRFLSDSQV